MDFLAPITLEALGYPPSVYNQSLPEYNYPIPGQPVSSANPAPTTVAVGEPYIVQEGEAIANEREKNAFGILLIIAVAALVIHYQKQ